MNKMTNLLGYLSLQNIYQSPYVVVGARLLFVYLFRDNLAVKVLEIGQKFPVFLQALALIDQGAEEGDFRPDTVPNTRFLTQVEAQPVEELSIREVVTMVKGGNISEDA